MEGRPSVAPWPQALSKQATGRNTAYVPNYSISTNSLITSASIATTSDRGATSTSVAQQAASDAWLYMDGEQLNAEAYMNIATVHESSTLQFFLGQFRYRASVHPQDSRCVCRHARASTIRINTHFLPLCTTSSRSIINARTDKRTLHAHAHTWSYAPRSGHAQKRIYARKNHGMQKHEYPPSQRHILSLACTYKERGRG
eukprot:6182861-Pleurochrysis_carterae.AAC.1